MTGADLLDSGPRQAAARGLAESRAVGAAIAVACVVFASLGVLELRLRLVRHAMVTRLAVDEATIPGRTSMRILTLGHTEWGADLLWTRALLYFGESVASRTGQAYLQRYAEAITDIDPNLRQAYLWGATVSIYNGRQIFRESVLNAIRHLERGIRVFPDDTEMIHQLGFNYFFEFPRFAFDDEERAAYRRRGAEYLRRAAALGYGPPWMALAAAEALQRVGLHDRAIEHLRDLYVRAEDPAVRDRIAAQIEAHANESGARDPYLESLRDFERERRAAFPYVPSALYLFVGPAVAGVRGASGEQQRAVNGP